MIHIAGIFKNRVPDTSCLLAFGFAETEGKYASSYGILEDHFQMDVTITGTGAVSVRVLDADNGEEYVLVHTPEASGAFVGSVVQACEEKLKIIAQNCFNVAVFRSAQAQQVIAYAHQAHQDCLEFLWEKFAGNAVFRRKDCAKWYAALLTVAGAKLGLAGDEAVEIIDLRVLPDEVEGWWMANAIFPATT